MTYRWLLPIVLLLLTACEDEKVAAPPPPATMSSEAIGHFCLMNVAEHPGPKGQAHVAGQSEPVWFPSVRDLLTFRVLPGETGEITALYVSDTAAAPSFEQIDPSRWVAAERAFYVIGSDKAGGMGASEAVPFADEADARAFQGDHGGDVVGLDGISRAWIFGENG
ncbi:MAG: nitrous oxide reductase accessory protein NosL [Geminicoccaceae bacterium]